MTPIHIKISGAWWDGEQVAPETTIVLREAILTITAAAWIADKGYTRRIVWSRVGFGMDPFYLTADEAQRISDVLLDRRDP